MPAHKALIALTDAELLAWLERTTSGWRGLVATNPQVLAFPCSTRETQNVAELLQHIVAVELRYAERLNDLPETPYQQISSDGAEDIFAVHDRATKLIRQVQPEPQAFWDDFIEFTTRSAGSLRAPRRTVLVHLAMHSIRHYAQLATLVREHGVAPAWGMDYLFMQTP